MSWETFISLRLLKSHKDRALFTPMTWVAVMGIAFAMTATLVSLSVISGFQKAYEQAILGFNAHLVIVREGGIENMAELQEAINSLKKIPKGVISQTPFIFREGLGLFPGEVAGVVIKGINPHNLQQMYPMHYYLPNNPIPVDAQKSAAVFEPLRESHDQNPPVILGKQLFDRFFPQGSESRPTIRLLIPKEEGVSAKLRDHLQEFEVVGIFESGLYEFDSRFLLASTKMVQDLFKMGSVYTGVEVNIEDPQKAPMLARQLEPLLPRDYQVVSWDELNASLFSAMKMEKTLFMVIMFLIILIASFNTLGIILMLVLSRQADMAILSGMGARMKSLTRIHAYYGVVLGLLGTALGSLLSLIILWSLKKYQWIALDPKIYFVTHLPVSWPFSLWAMMILATLILCYIISHVATQFMVKKGHLLQVFR